MNSDPSVEKNEIVKNVQFLHLKNEITFDFQGRVILAKVYKDDLEKTIRNVRGNLETLTDDIGVIEQVILYLSKNWAPIIRNSLANEVKSYYDWKIGIEKRYCDMKKTIKENFPELWETMEFQLSVKNIIHIKNCTLPFAGIILGPPSSSKTVGIEMFRDSPNTFYTDSFSAKAFVSHNTSVSRDKLQQIDLLPKIKDKIFLSPELSPTFSKKDDELVETLGILIRVLDGKGYESDTGAHGHRGYTGEFMFVWIGAAVDIPRKVHKHLSTLGPKLYFYRLSKIPKTEDEYIHQLEGEDFGIKFEKIKGKVADYIEWFERYPVSGETDKDLESSDKYLVKAEWDKMKNDRQALRYIVKLAGLLAHLRGSLQTWESKETQGTDYAYSIPIIEERDRAATQLYNLARGHGLSQGRNYITIEDIPLVIKVVLSTASIERVKVFDLLLRCEGRLSTSQITKALSISNPTARRTMAEFKGLGIVDMDGIETEEHVYDNTEKSMTLKPEFKWFLSEEFRRLREGFTPDLDHYLSNIPDGDSKDSKEELKEKTLHSITYNENHDSNKNYEVKESRALIQKTEDEEKNVVNYSRNPIFQEEMNKRKAINEKNMYRLWEGGDIHGCRKCSFQGDKWDVLAHLCKNNK